MTAADLSEAVGNTPGYTSAVLTGRKPLNDEWLKTVAKALGLKKEECETLQKAAELDLTKRS